jgi:hypothetical protein
MNKSTIICPTKATGDAAQKRVWHSDDVANYIYPCRQMQRGYDDCIVRKREITKREIAIATGIRWWLFYCAFARTQRVRNEKSQSDH